MWNDTDVPLAYLITFRTYGTWLHGDERGSVDRHNNIYGTPRIPPNIAWNAYSSRLLKNKPVLLSAEQRKSVDAAIKAICIKRAWRLFAHNVRTNHAHAVVSSIASPDLVLIALKANSTRQMRMDGCWTINSTPWAEKGSKRYLWNDESIEKAIDYVLYGQGDQLPDFE